MSFWDELHAEMIVDEQTTGSSVPLQCPFLGFWRGDGSVQQTGRAGGEGVYVVESVLDERVHHETCRPDTHADTNLTFLFCFQSKATGISASISRTWEAWAE